MAFNNYYYLVTSFFLFIITATTHATADLIQGCGGFVEASSSLIKSRKPTDAKLDYSHITVELRTVDGLVKDRTQCAPNGYYFIPVYDKGSFVIKIRGPEGWSWDPDQVPVVVDHTGCNANEDINFRFTGFTVSGNVGGAVGGESCRNRNGGPSNVNIELLYSTGDLISSVLTSATGSYSFTNIIPGKYKLRASRSDLNVEHRGSMEVELGFGNGLVEDLFFVSGYDIRGSVVAQGNPILGVHIYLYSSDVSSLECPQGPGNAPGQRKPLCHAVSDEEGMFTFKSVPCGVYELIPYYKGENTVFDVSPPSMSVSVEHDHATVLPKFQVTGFSVGGRVVDGNGFGVDGVRIIVDGHERCITDKEGYYKLDQVTSSRYTIEAKKEHYKFDKLKDFMVLPNMASVVDIKAVSYDVCGVVQMVSLGYKAKVALTHGPENVKPHVKQTDESGNICFEVKHTYPGKELGEDKWCWEQRFIDIDVATDDVKGITFVQKGYWVNAISTHNVDAYMTQPDGSTVNLNIKRGSQQICVESPGVHELQFVNSCIFFGSSSTKIDTSNPLPIHLKGERYLLTGQIHVDSSSLSGVDELPENILVGILDSEGTLLNGTSARLVPAENDKASAAVFEYSVWANPGEKLTFAPQDSREKAQKQILFYPRQHVVSVIQDGCQASVPIFSGRPGMYIKGSVSPPLSGVYVRVIAAGDSRYVPLKKGDVALETVTGTEGFYIGGPLYDDISYSIEASKPGYYVKPVGPHSFSCQKLGQISVHIYSKEDVKEPFPSVLLSLSGEDGYRNNSITAAGGIFLFDNLFPGSFYLRPLLKEYAFSPPAQAIDLGSGEAKEIIFQATRVAYSAMGMVTLLSGQPKEGVSVEARSESKGFYEETVTDSSGNYRLRGLHPDTTYIVKVAEKGDLKSTRIERTSPESVSVKVGSDDIKGLDFLVFEQPELTILSGHVEGKRIDELHSHLRVEIKSANDPSKIESVFPLPLSNFFQVKDLPRAKHLLQLRSALPSATHKFESDVIEVDLEKHTQIHVGPIRYRVEEDFHKQELTTAPVYPLIAGVSVIALFICMPRLKDLYQATMGVYVSSSNANGRKEVRKPVIRKKTY
ncbi:uncharacterized protein LOC131304587 isoform X3 [Rhododendron vialii]|uniref:uncharacterized protein LOC131304587 isoform X3 n=1 Tax=Rhododendron vialii TaxID=182163 RepID=UPI00265E79DA|nr:uncharacterized protein LOC131304587 isoform X3 [Rhododendron vialii]